MLSHFDRRQFNGERRADEVARYYAESGILDLLVDLESKGHTQNEMVDRLIAEGFKNAHGQPSFTQALISKILRRARERGQIAAPLA